MQKQFSKTLATTPQHLLLTDTRMLLRLCEKKAQSGCKSFSRGLDEAQKAGGGTVGVQRVPKMKKPLINQGFQSGRNRTRTCDPIDVNDVLWAIGQVVKLKYGREHTSEALEIRAFLRFGLCSRCPCSGCVQPCSRIMNTGVFRGVQGVFTGLLCSFSTEHKHRKSLTVMRRQAIFYLS